ncbi:MerR family transcriptional regulator, copper efflux regulator [Rosenbergiella nectarea]|uniref:HTH-type transcriptional regulator CueR n=1 Tax=Rosenbergiella nectarea TaxID=988801 RepID=A0A1H9IF81_9GAMM|nr:Cu(I)-responsive transcriptional regulator [Rosenbergiella nectarea]SEQ73214.1 MerR family transcriptional regulator, copper efflux regulator [Rosenbergiella nectarea]
MNISQAAQRTGLSSKAIRFYEDRGLFTPPPRTLNGYRDYHEQHIEELTLIKQAKAAGFSLDECREFVGLYRDPHRRSADIKARTLQKIEQLTRQLDEITQIRDRLVRLAAHCPGDDNAECPIISGWTKGCHQNNP